jgi:hypothetical protein
MTAVDAPFETAERELAETPQTAYGSHPDLTWRQTKPRWWVATLIDT